MENYMQPSVEIQLGFLAITLLTRYWFFVLGQWYHKFISKYTLDQTLLSSINSQMCLKLNNFLKILYI